jgi:hypothetical protein
MMSPSIFFLHLGNRSLMPLNRFYSTGLTCRRTRFSSAPQYVAVVCAIICSFSFSPTAYENSDQTRIYFPIQNRLKIRSRSVSVS